MLASTARRFPHLAAAGVVVALACLLYFPFLKNPFIFDDISLFSGSDFAHFAMLPRGIHLRHLPHFSLAFPQVMWGHFPPWGHPELHRMIGLAFHIACSLALYKLLYELVLAAKALPGGLPADDARANARTLALVGAAVFAIHPVAVYGAGYLIQRTIVVATLFSLLSVMYFVRGLSRGSHVDAISAAVFYALAVFSKEHSVLLPAVAVLAVPLVAANPRFAVRHAALYLTACAPAAIVAALIRKGVIGSGYEPFLRNIAEQLEGASDFDMSEFPWSLSAVTQAGLFFRYLVLWVWPDTGAMSVDLRVDFIEGWTPGRMVLKVAAFGASGAAGFLLLRRGGRSGLVGIGLLYAWVLFLVEFTAVRFQEPFVLYRSYLWAPGVMIALVAVLAGLSRRMVLAAFAVACPVLLYQAHDRLVSFSHPFVLWQDAVAKLPEKPVPWGSRALHKLGREYVYRGQLPEADRIAERCLAQYPNTYHCHFARGAVHLEMKQFEPALPHMQRALELRPDSAFAHNHLGVILENLGRRAEARAAYQRASELGLVAADNRIRRLDAAGLAPPAKTNALTAPGREVE